ncbi:MAG: hypothetical protein Q4B60_03545 [Erysipelotrichaceae bacterium]|nr:hypothetical protein [Erysipelotrichaceae bacterium]
MKILIRSFGLTVMGVYVCLMLFYVYDLNIRYDELNRISTIAMANTQILMQENIEDKYFGTSNARVNIDDNDTYLNIYKENLNKLVSTNSDYEVSDYYADYNSGLLYVLVRCKYKSLTGNYRYIDRKLINFIDVLV